MTDTLPFPLESPGDASQIDVCLDDLIVAPQWRSRHARVVAAPPARVWEAMLTVSIDDHPAVRLLTGARAAPGRLRAGSTATRPRTGRTLIELAPYPLVGVVPGESVVMAGVDKPWRLSRPEPARRLDADAIRRFHEPGWVKLAMDISIAVRGDGALLTTETRVLATDDAARRAFGRYWRLIRRPSGLIRRIMLDRIATAAERPGR